MSEDDWYRNEQWNDEIEAHFWDKLKRARSQRDQYLHIQISILARNYPRKALEMADMYFDTRKDPFFDVDVMASRANACLKLGHKKEAAKFYRAVMAMEAEKPSHKTGSELKYPYYVAVHRVEEEYEFALRWLENIECEFIFPLERFYYHAARALILQDADEADKALSAAEDQRSDAAKHPFLGLVGSEEKSVIKRLKKMNGGGKSLLERFVKS